MWEGGTKKTFALFTERWTQRISFDHESVNVFSNANQPLFINILYLLMKNNVNQFTYRTTLNILWFHNIKPNDFVVNNSLLINF